MTCKDGHCNHDADGQLYIGHLLKPDDQARVGVAPVHCCDCGRVANAPSFQPEAIAALRQHQTFTRLEHGALA